MRLPKSMDKKMQRKRIVSNTENVAGQGHFMKRKFLERVAEARK